MSEKEIRSWQNVCKHCKKGFGPNDYGWGVSLRQGKYVVVVDGTEGPMHRNCADKVAKDRNEES